MIAKPKTIEAAIELTRREAADPRSVYDPAACREHGSQAYEYFRSMQASAERRLAVLESLRGRA